MDVLPIQIGSFCRLPADLPKGLKAAIKSEFSHANPEFYSKQNMGYSTFGTPRTIKTFIERDGCIEVPRGGIGKLRQLISDYGIAPKYFVSTKTSAPVDFPPFCVDPDDETKTLRPYQLKAIEACVGRTQGIVRAPTGSGKTTIAMALIGRLKQRTLVVLRNKKLADQWAKEARRCLGLSKKEVRVLRGGKVFKLYNSKITIATQQTLHAKGPDAVNALAADDPFGLVIVDEVQGAAAKTFIDVIAHFPAHYRFGFSADETRKDKKEFLIYDMFGDVIFEITRQEVEDSGFIVPVTIRMIPTEYRHDRYEETKDWNNLLADMGNDPERHAQVIETAKRVQEEGVSPCFIFSHRREYAETISDTMYAHGITCGLMLGGVGKSSARFDEALDQLWNGIIDFGSGTYQAIGVGLNIPKIAAGIMAQPIGNNPQFFNQVRGRVARVSDGKEEGVLYYLWDRHVFPDHLRRLARWNDDRVEVLVDGEFIHWSRYST